MWYDSFETFGSLDDYLADYEDGKLTAKAVYEAVPEHGPLYTIRLRRKARLSTESAKSRFDRGLWSCKWG